MSRKFASGRPLTDAEEAEIQEMIGSDPDNPEITDAQIAAGGKTFAEAFPDLSEVIRRGRGRPTLADAKQAVTLRLSPATLAKFQATGDSWRKLMAEVLDRAKVK